MSVGRFILRGWAFQSRVYAPWALGNSGILPSVQVPTTRLRLLGTSPQRLAITGTSQERLTTLGQSAARLSLEGSSP
jgi:hypothetical protein